MPKRSEQYSPETAAHLPLEESLTDKDLLEYVKQQSTLATYLEQHGALPLLNPNLFFRDARSSLTLTFVKQTEYEATGELVFIPLDLITHNTAGQEVWLRRCIGLRIETQPLRQLSLPVGYDLHWAQEHGVSIQPDDSQTSFGDGFVYCMTPASFLELTAPTPAQTKQLSKKPKPLKVPKIEATGIPRKHKLPPHKLKITNAEIIELKGLTGPYRTVQAATYKTYLTVMVNYHGVPNNPAALRYHLEKLSVMPPATLELSQYRLPAEDQERLFSLASLQQFIGELWAGPFDGLDLKVNFPNLSFSQFGWIYQSLLRLYSQESLHLPTIPADPEVSFAEEQFPFFKISELHRLDASMDAVRSRRNPRSVFPTNPDRAAALEQLMAVAEYPFFPTPRSIEESYSRAHEWLIHEARLKPGSLSSPNWWLEPENAEVLESSTSLLTQYWAERAMFEEDQLQLTPDIYRDVQMQIRVGGRHDRPYGLSFFAQFDQLHQQYSHQMELEDLKVSSYHFETRGLSPRQTQHIRHQIKAEVETREQQLWLFLSQIFFTHFIHPRTQSLLEPNHPGLYMTTLKEEKLYRPQPEILTSRRWFEPGSGEAELEAVTLESERYQEMVFFISEIIAPFVHMLHAFEFDLERFEERVRRG